MSAFENKVAIVTGGASGIGRAVGEALARHGARVVLADVDQVRATSVAEGINDRGGRATGAALDVTDAGAVRRLVEGVAAEHGRIDYMFNNAGIALFGEVRDMELEDWNRIIDVNLRGVVNGVATAYPLMIQQGSGHIVNTASAAGLAPAPGATAYATTKHAVVGLSTSLRAEAAHFGVKVSAVCPGFVDTPIKDSMKLLNCDRQTAIDSLPIRLQPADDCARAILRGVNRNQAIIAITAITKIGWLLYRLSPALVTRLMESQARRSALLGRGG